MSFNANSHLSRMKALETEMKEINRKITLAKRRIDRCRQRVLRDSLERELIPALRSGNRTKARSAFERWQQMTKECESIEEEVNPIIEDYEEELKRKLQEYKQTQRRLIREIKRFLGIR